MQVQTVALERGFTPGLHRQRRASGAVDGFTVHLPPSGDAFKNGDVLGINITRAHRADVHQQIAAARRGLGQQLDEMGRRLVQIIKRIPAVGFIGGGNAFPDAVVRRKIGGAVGGVVIIPPAAYEPAADDHVRVRRAHGLHDAQVFCGRQFAGGVEPENGGMIQADQFTQLRDGFFIHVLAGLGHEFRPLEPPVHAAEFLIAARIGLIPVVAGGVGIRPVKGLRIIKSELDPILVAGGAEIGHRIMMPRGGVHDVVIIHFRGPHRKAVMMLGGDDDVFHAGIPGEAHPGIGVKVGGIEFTGDLRTINRAGNF